MIRIISKKNWSVYLIALNSLFFIGVLALIYLFLCQPDRQKISINRVKKENEWVELYQNNKQEFDGIAEEFLNQAEYRDMQYQNQLNTSTCNEENFAKCSIWYLKAGDIASDVYHDGYKLETSNEFANFMKKYKIMFMSNTDFPSNVKNFQIGSADFGLCGLKYYPDGSNFELKEDNEFIKVIKIDNNWYYFCEDWN